MNSSNQQGFSTVEQSNQVAELMQFSTFEKYGTASQSALYIILLVGLVFLIWSAMAESDVCAEAKGQIEPRTRIQQLRPTADGTIAEYHVVDGQEVKAGEVLIVLNTIRAESELKKKEQELSIFEIQKREHENARDGLMRIIANPQLDDKQGLAVPDADRIAGELFASKKSLDAANYDFSSNSKIKGKQLSPEMMILQEQQLRLNAVKESRKASITHKTEAREAEKKKLEARIEMLSAGLEKARLQLSELEASLSDAKKEMQIYEKGRELGVASEVKFLEVQNYMHQREFSVAQQKLQISQMEQELKAAQLDLSSSQPAYNAEQADLAAGVKAEDTKISTVPLSMNETTRTLLSKQAAFEVASFHARARYSKELTEIANLDRKIEETASAIEMLKMELADKYIKSPVDGTVSELLHLMPGQIVLRGQELMTIVPEDKELVLRAEVNNTDVGFVELGQDARLRVLAFPCEEFGVIQGKVVRVDDYPEEKVDKQKKVSVYKITILPETPYLQAGKKRLNLQPGLEVEADIVIRKRSLLALLFEPLLKMGNIAS